MEIVQLKMIFRGWMRYKIYTVISLLSLVVGLTCSLFMAGFVTSEYRIADVIENSEHWYTLKGKSVFEGTDDQKGVLGWGNGNIGAIMHSRFPEVKDFCVFHDCWIKLKKDDQFVDQEGFFEATPNIPDLFHQKIVEGNLYQTLSRPGEVAVTRSFALRVLGKEDVIGMPLTFQISKAVRTGTGIYTKLCEETYTVTTVIDDSQRGFLNYKVLKGLPRQEIDVSLKSWVGVYYTFIRLDERTGGKEFEKKLKTDSTFQEAKLIPLKEVYFTSSGGSDGLTLSQDPALIHIGISIALAVLVIACFNYVNIALTRSLQRLRSTGQQMVFGASELQMRMQLLAETAMQTLLALGIALVLIWKMLPQFNLLFGARLVMSDFCTGITPWFLILLLSAVIFLPSLYIFSRLGQTHLTRILKQDYCRRPRLITGMVVAQFAVSIVLLLFVVNVYRQMDFIAHNRPDAERILMLNEDENLDADAWDMFCQKLTSIPEIEKMARGSGLSEWAVSNNGRLVNMINCDERYFDFYDLNFVEGQPFTAYSPKGTIVVNEAFVEKWNIKEPIGYTFDFNGGHYVICGVVHDFIIDNLTRAISPLMIVPDDPWLTVVSVAPGNRKAAIDKMQALWKEIAPAQPPFGWKTLADTYLDFHRDQQRMMKMVMVFSWISLVLTCLGLFGLAWYSVEKRMKEIALRKVNGAKESEVIGLLCGRFMKWILWSFFIALPFACYFSDEWLKQFVYKEPVSVWIYIFVGFFALLVGGLTVVWQSWRAAVRNPVEVLKGD